MEPLNHFQLMAAFIQGQRITGRTVEGHGYPQVELEVLDVTADLVTVRSSWGGVMHVGPNTSWISYYASEVRQIEPSRPSKIWLGPPPGIENMAQLPPPPPSCEPSLAEIYASATVHKPKPKPKPNPMPSRFPCVIHVTPPTLFECRVITGNWISAIFKRLFGWDIVDVECSIQNFRYRNSYVTFELHTEHGDDLFIRLRPEAARALAAKINEGESR